MLVLAILLLVYVPGEGVQWPVLLGTIAVVAIGELVIRLTEHKRQSGGERRIAALAARHPASQEMLERAIRGRFPAAVAPVGRSNSGHPGARPGNVMTF